MAGKKIRKTGDREIFLLHAEFCKVLANSKRLMIIDLLSQGEMCVGDMVAAMGSSLANISQHLRVLRARNIVRSRKEGQTVFYSLTDKRIPKACTLIRCILLDGIRSRGDILKRIDS